MPLVPRNNNNTLEADIKPKDSSFRPALKLNHEAEKDFRRLKAPKTRKQH